MNIVAKLCSVWRSSSALTRPTRLLERNATGVRCRGSKRRSYFAFRMSMRELLTQQLHCRHGHMIGIDDLLMQDGMAADYEEIYRVTRQIYEIVPASPEDFPHHLAWHRGGRDILTDS